MFCNAKYRGETEETIVSEERGRCIKTQSFLIFYRAVFSVSGGLIRCQIIAYNL